MSIKVTASIFKRLANGRRKVINGKVYHARKSLALEGAPGMGKTAVIRSLGKDWDLPSITVSINQWVNAADIVGFTYKGRRSEDGNFELAGEDDIPPWLPVYRVDPVTGAKVMTSDETKGFKVWHDKKTNQPEAHAAVVLLDEFSAAKPSVQQAFLCVALDKVVKNFRLHEDTISSFPTTLAKETGSRAKLLKSVPPSWGRTEDLILWNLSLKMRLW